MAKPWYDVEMRGRRLERISKHMNKKFWNNMKDNNPDIAFAYFDRMVKIEHVIQPYIEQITGVRELIKKGKKVAPNISR